MFYFFQIDFPIESIIESLILCQEHKIKVLPSKLLREDEKEKEETIEKFLKINDYNSAKTFASLNLMNLDAICLNRVRKNFHIKSYFIKYFFDF